MTPLAFSTLFVAALAVSLVLRYWLASRQIRHVALHRGAVPAAFEHRVPLHAHQRAADYTIARTRFALLETASSAAVLVGFTLLGGLQWLHDAWLLLLPDAPLPRQLLLLASVTLIGGLLDLPMEWYRQFRLEQRFGFNRMSLRLWIADLFRGAAIGALLGLPLAAAALWLMRAAGQSWWLWVWLLWMAFSLFVMLVYPTVIAPMFNRFDPLPQGPVRDRVEALLGRCGFASKGLYVMDGSRRSAHGNAYFTGFGRGKRIVFFDTLLSRLDEDEIEAVLAHELGHFRLRHIVKRMLMGAAASLAGLWLLGVLARQPWFYQGLGVGAPVDLNAVALLLFFLALPVFTFPLQPLFSLLSRRHEFEADAFASQHARAGALASALVKLYEDNAATLTPDPVHSAFHDSHPPAAQRIGRLLAA
ncbi:MAG TPA: M48 family metallopeptidase [Quisquiliibacterium sp.]|nr:M48 family metallopeptidase [Quisquiliibacterium sp.]